MIRVLKLAGGAIAAILLLLLVTFAIPLEDWRTGEQPRPDLVLRPPDAAPEPARRIWIDTDAACGAGRDTDPDDCFAILALATWPGVHIAGISTVFGNAPAARTHAVTDTLVRRIAADDRPSLDVFPGAHAALETARTEREPPAWGALRAALREAPLTIVALGPLTNIAAALEDHADLAGQVAGIIAVMGRRTGHVFHPGEGAGGGILFGHGPVFRDFNVSADAAAVARVLDLDVPLTLIPYEAAREVEITAPHLDAMARAGGARAWVAQRARNWLDFWNDDVGRVGFYPFDLLAAVRVTDPGRFRCADVRAWIGADRTLIRFFGSPSALLVTQDRAEIDDPLAETAAIYCPRVRSGMDEVLDGVTGRARRMEAGS